MLQEIYIYKMKWYFLKTFSKTSWPLIKNSKNKKKKTKAYLDVFPQNQGTGSDKKKTKKHKKHTQQATWYT